MDSTEQLYSSIGERIRMARLRAKFSQHELGEQVGLTRTSITNIESGQQKIQVHTLYAIADALNVEVADFLPNVKMEENTIHHLVVDRSVIGEDGLEKLTQSERELITSFVSRNQERSR